MNSRFTSPGLARGLTPPPDGDLVDLRRLLGIARRQARAAALCTLAGLALGVAYLATATPLYTSTTTLFINPLTLPGAPLTGAVAPVVAVSMFDSEIGILRSEKIASDAFDALDSAWLETPDSLLARLKALLHRGPAARPEARRQHLLDRLRATLEVERPTPPSSSSSYTSPSPQRAAAILDAFLQAYLADRTEKRKATAAAELASIAVRIEDLRLRLAGAAAAAGEVRPQDARAMAVFAGLRGQAEAYGAAINQLIVRQEEVRQLAKAPDDAVRVVSPARVPVFDSSPNAARALLLATLAGALAGVGTGLLREASERGFRGAGQVRRELGVPCLALLPALPPGASPLALDPSDGRAEALRAIKLAIDQATGISRVKLVGFAPVAAGDGATTTALSFAALLASGGAPTLYLDADMRGDRGSEKPGLADLLSGRTVSPTLDAVTGLHVLPAGTDRQGATAVVALAAPEVGEAIAHAAVPFDCAVVDLPPLDRFVDARAMARHLDAIVIVARWRRTERRQLRAILTGDRELRRKLVGIILNCATPAAADRYDDDFAPDELA